jgi:hypothetical protein
MYSTVRYLRALHLTGENKLLSHHQGGRRTLSPVGQHALQVPLDHSSSVGYRLKQVPGYFPHFLNPGAPVADQLPSFLSILPRVDAFIVGRGPSRIVPRPSPPISELPYPSSSLGSEPHPPYPPRKIRLPGIRPSLGVANLVARLHQILDDMKFVLHHLGFPKAPAHAIRVNRAHSDRPARIPME